ncbi:hypothetical protein SAMN05444065_1621, partial [Pseudomonas syringae]
PDENKEAKKRASYFHPLFCGNSRTERVPHFLDGEGLKLASANGSTVRLNLPHSVTAQKIHVSQPSEDSLHQKAEECSYDDLDEDQR